MAIDSEGNLILSCPNFANPTLPGCVLKIDKDRNITKWFDVPVREDTGMARPMGIGFGPDGDLYLIDNQPWLEKPELIRKGRLLRLRIEGNTVVKCTVVANNMEHPNGLRIHNGYVYLTQSKMELVEDPSGKLVSCVYRFGLDEENIQITNTLADPHILCTYLTQNPKDQYGVDGIEFDREGNLLIGNFGDGAVYKVTFNEDGSVKSNEVWAQDPEELESTDGMIMDEDGNLYIADFCANAIVKSHPMVKPSAGLLRAPIAPVWKAVLINLASPSSGTIGSLPPASTQWSTISCAIPPTNCPLLWQKSNWINTHFSSYIFSKAADRFTIGCFTIIIYVSINQTKVLQCFFDAVIQNVSSNVFRLRFQLLHTATHAGSMPRGVEHW